MTDDERKLPPGLRAEDFWAYSPQGNFLCIPSRDLWPKSVIDRRLPKIGKSKPSTWLWRHRSIDQMSWAPGQEEIVENFVMADGGWISKPGWRLFNLYRPPDTEPGQAKFAKPWLDHLHKVYPNDAEHFILWCAHRRQKPWEKINHALLLGGQQGIGKDTLLEPLRYAVGPWNYKTISPQIALGRFNAWKKAVILVISEAADLGDINRYALYESLKDIIIGPPVQRVDEKNLREYVIPNVIGVIITTNHKADGMYLPPDDRRHFVMWSILTKTDFDPTYWQRLWTWYDVGGIRHVLAFLDEVDISKFDPAAPPPQTQAFFDIVDAHQPYEHSELRDLLDEIKWPDAITLSTLTTRANGQLAPFLSDRKNRRVILFRLEKVGYSPVRNPYANDGLWKKNGARQAVYAKEKLSEPDRVTAAAQLSDI